MNTNKIVILCIIMGVLGGGLWYRKQNRIKDTTTPALHTFADDVDTDAITSIELGKGNATIILDKKNGWTVRNLQNAPASTTAVESFLREIKSLSGELRSNDASILADFGLDDPSALHLVARQNEKEKLHILLGKGDFRNVFVRTKDSSAVYAAPGNILNAAGMQRPTMDGQFWIDTSLLNLNLPEVRSLSVSTPDYEIRYAQKSATNATAPQEWFMNATRGKGPSESQVKGVLLASTRINASEVLLPDDNRIKALSNPAFRLIVETGNATECLEASRPAPNGEAIVRIKGNPFAYTMHSSVFERLFPSPAKDSK